MQSFMMPESSTVAAFFGYRERKVDSHRAVSSHFPLRWKLGIECVTRDLSHKIWTLRVSGLLKVLGCAVETLRLFESNVVGFWFCQMKHVSYNVLGHSYTLRIIIDIGFRCNWPMNYVRYCESLKQPPLHTLVWCTRGAQRYTGGSSMGSILSWTFPGSMKTTCKFTLNWLQMSLNCHLIENTYHYTKEGHCQLPILVTSRLLVTPTGPFSFSIHSILNPHLPASSSIIYPIGTDWLYSTTPDAH